ncbi:MAG: hypothetical protein ACSLFN_15265 [Candidatus Limnocylindrales bacterium]
MNRRSINPSSVIVAAAIVTAAWILGAAAGRNAATGAAAPAASAGATASAAAAAPSPVDYVGKVTLTPSEGPAGTPVTIVGSGFDGSVKLSITWQSVAGSWLLKGDRSEEFHGRAFEPLSTPLDQITTDAAGAFETSFVAPVDYGFYHDVTVEQDGALRNKASFRLEPTVTVEPRSGPPGTMITIRMEGVGWANLENSWLVTYDNQFTGLLSAVTTGGTAVATIPATGGPGEHLIRVVHGSFTVPYLNMQQSPRPDRPTFTIPFRVTTGEAVPIQPLDTQALSVVPGAAPDGTGPAIWTDPATAPVGTPVVVRGRGLAGGATAVLTWTTVIGNRVGGDGWDTQTSELGSVSIGPDGTFEFRKSVPDDLGGAHQIEALVGGQSVAQATLVITPSIVGFSPTRGEIGTDIEIHMKGVGWTETANIYTVVYDNGYLGYACGFNTQGDVTIHLPATGEPGWHYIDLYPGIYKGKDVPGVQNFRIPQLTYAGDHPGEQLPAFHLAFEVTAG